MTRKHPPVVATWLLRHLGSSPNNEAVLGDLAEEYSRKGATWYWRQALKAIPVGAFREARGHKWMAVKAVLVALVVWIVFNGSELTIGYFVPPGPRPSFDILTASRHPLGGWSAVLYQPVFKGLYTKHSNPLLFLLWIQIVLPLMAWALCGWIVARIDTRFDRLPPRIHYRRDIVIVFASLMLLMHLLLIGPAMSEFVRRGASNMAIPLAAYAVASVVAILVGGSLHRETRHAVSLE